MGWFSRSSGDAGVSSDHTAEQSEPVQTNYVKGQKILMRDTKPRFDPDGGSSLQGEPSKMMKAAIQTIGWGDFSFAKLSNVPCFRDAGMVGFSSMFILGSITLLYHKNPAKAANWATCGLLLGSIVGWEQCRMKRKKNMEISQKAMEIMAERRKNIGNNDSKKPKRKEISEDRKREIEKLKKDWESHPNDVSGNKKWYKFW